MFRQIFRQISLNGAKSDKLTFMRNPAYPYNFNNNVEQFARFGNPFGSVSAALQIPLIQILMGHPMTGGFDPFKDRTARDIRNTLSSALIMDLVAAGSLNTAQAALNWENTPGLLPVHQDYLRKTRRRYEAVLNHINAEQLTEPRHQARVLWNAGLFFELHELLETIWHDTRGDERIGLKGLIQAAGAYVHSLRGAPGAAMGLASRARGNLQQGRCFLGFIGNLDQLIESLADPSQPPPTLNPETE